MVRAQANQVRKTRQLFLVFLCVPLATFGQAKLIDRSVALIDGQVLTLSELQFEARVLLIQAGGVEAAFGDLDDVSSDGGTAGTTLRRVLHSVIGQRLLI